ncbi:MAG: hypothetical protein Q9165_005966 [Trypethelium subeluteriae]
MGRPSQPEILPAYEDEVGEGRAAETASLHSAVSLHTYEEQIVNGGLPSYTDDPETGSSDRQGVLSNPSQESSETTPWHDAVLATSAKQITLDPIFSKDPNALYSLLEHQSRYPPRPIFHFEGHHLENKRQSDGKTKQERVTDFHIILNCTNHLITGLSGDILTIWPTLSAILDDTKAHRGTLFRRRAKRATAKPPDLESGAHHHNHHHHHQQGPGTAAAAAATPDEDRIHALKTWCHIFSSRAAHSAFPCTFRLTRRVGDWDTALLSSRLTAMIRGGTNYRGRVAFEVKMEGAEFVVYSEHWMNRLRLNRWVYWVCVVLQLWILTWPLLWLCTARFEIVEAVWPFKLPREEVVRRLAALGEARGRRRGGSGEEGEEEEQEVLPALHEPWCYASMSEEEFLASWGKMIVVEAVARRQGEVGREDLMRVMQAEREEREGRGRRGSGNAVVDTVVGVVAGIQGVSEQRDRALGWGGDDLGGGAGSVSVGGLTIGGSRLGRIRLG